MFENNNILILVADDDEAARQTAANVLQSHGYQVIQAINGSAAIKVLEDWDVAVAVLAHRMKPHDGFEVVRHMQAQGYDPGIVMLTDTPSTDLLLLAGQYGIGQVMRKPVDPARLAETVRRMLRARGRKTAPGGGPASGDTSYTPDTLMDRAIALARQNARAGMGGPFGAAVADAAGHLLGEGVNSVAALCDPSAQAEVLAIRRAAEKLGTPRLDGCFICCSTEPAMLGAALIAGTGIAAVYFGISHDEAGTPRNTEQRLLIDIARPALLRALPYRQIHKEEAFAVFRDKKNS